MTPISASTTVLVSTSDSEPSARPPDSLPHDGTIPPTSASHYSSVHQTALALVTCASEQAGAEAAVLHREPLTHQEQIAAERTKTAIQRANAEQARRTAESARSAFQSLLEHLTQPWLALDDIGRVVRWNAAVAKMTGISEPNAIGQLLSNLFPTQLASQVEAGNVALREAAEFDFSMEADPAFVLTGTFPLNNGMAVNQMTLLPLFRIPGVVESVIVLFDDAPV